MAQQESILPWLVVGAASIFGYEYAKKRGLIPRFIMPGMHPAMLPPMQLPPPAVVKAAKVVTAARRMVLQLQAVRLLKKGIELDLVIQNPNPTGFTISAVVGNVVLSYSGKSINAGTAASYKKTLVQPEGSTKYTLSVALKEIDLVAYFSDVYAGKVTNQAVTFDGTVTIDNQPFSVREKKQLT